MHQFNPTDLGNIIGLDTPLNALSLLCFDFEKPDFCYLKELQRKQGSAESICLILTAADYLSWPQPSDISAKQTRHQQQQRLTLKGKRLKFVFSSSHTMYASKSASPTAGASGLILSDFKIAAVCVIKNMHHMSIYR